MFLLLQIPVAGNQSSSMAVLLSGPLLTQDINVSEARHLPTNISWKKARLEPQVLEQRLRLQSRGPCHATEPFRLAIWLPALEGLCCVGC